MPPLPQSWYESLRLRILPLSIAIRFHRPAAIPPHIMANVLRGAFNITFRRLVCPPEWMNNACPQCPLYENCPYGRVFEPTPPRDADRLRLQADLPRPFVLKPPLMSPAAAYAQELSRERPANLAIAASNSTSSQSDSPLRSRLKSRTENAGGSPPLASGLQFGLVLFGNAADHLAHFIVTLAELGRVGIGPHRVPFSVESVTTPSTAAALARQSDFSSSHGSGDRSPMSPREMQSLYDPATHTFHTPQRILTTSDLIAASLQTDTADPAAQPTASDSSYSPARLTLRFLTPTLIRTGSRVEPDGRRIPAQEVRDRPEFGVIIRRLRDRLSTLCTFFGESPWTGPDFAEMGQLADEVKLVHSQTEWTARHRYSTRTEQTHEISGLTGTATYEFPTPAHQSLFLPLLLCGQQIHTGKHAVWGNGWVEVIE